MKNPGTMAKIKTAAAAVLMAVLMSACTEGVVYNQYRTVPESGWDMDSSLTFVYEAADTIGAYDLILSVRHRDDYRYQNMWLFVNSSSPQGYDRSDTLEFYLADNRGAWLSQRGLSYYEMPVLYMQNVRFPVRGEYHFEVVQGLRDTVLTGVESVGLMIKKTGIERPETDAVNDDKDVADGQE